MGKRYLGVDVLTAARDRIAVAFDEFPRVYVSFSGGKDSSVMLHLVAEEARRRGRRFGLLFIDLEAQYQATIEFIEEMFREYADVTDPYWVALPLNLRNAVSQFEPQWMCWDPERTADWVRRPPPMAITDEGAFPFFRRRMEFEEFTPDFAHWYSQGEPTMCFVGIRTQESLNRWRTIASHRKQTFEGHQWTTWLGGAVYNAYPIYDWATEDVWRYNGRTGAPYNRLYDRMHQAGLTIHQARICQPYGDDQRKGLWLYQVIEPATWARVVHRVNGANMGALYARTSGNVLGRITITKPDGVTWQEYAMRLLESMPPPTAEHYRDKIAVFLQWWRVNGGVWPIPDDGSLTTKEAPSWARICKVLLRNDYWAKGLSFSQTKPDAYDKYRALMRRRRDQWAVI